MTSKDNDTPEQSMEKTVDELNNVLPSMNVNVPAPQQEEISLISDESLLGIYGEIIDNLREDRKEIKDLVVNFVEMVINDGDASTASKEALVNLLKIQSDTADKMAKIADLMTRVKMKEKDTFPRYLAAHQNNTIHIGDGSKRELLKQIERLKKKDDK